MDDDLRISKQIYSYDELLETIIITSLCKFCNLEKKYSFLQIKKFIFLI